MNSSNLQNETVKIQENEQSQIKWKNEQTPKKIFQALKESIEDANSTLPKNFHQSYEKVMNVQFTTSRKKSKKLWCKEEDDLLRHLILNNGPRDWAAISSHFVERCGKQCRQRWHNHLREGIKKGEWNFQEEWILFLGVQAYGKKWSIISKLLKGRPQNTLKNHWNCKMIPKKSKMEQKMKNIMRNGIYVSECLKPIQVKLLEQIIKKSPFQSLKSSTNDINVNEILLKVYKQSWEGYLNTKKEIQKWLISEKQKQKNNPKKYNLTYNVSFGKTKLQNYSDDCLKENSENSELQFERINLHFNMNDVYKIEYNSPKKEDYSLMQVEQNGQASSFLEQNYEADQIKEEHFDSDSEDHYHSSNEDIPEFQMQIHDEIESFVSPENNSRSSFHKMFLGRSNQKK